MKREHTHITLRITTVNGMVPLTCNIPATSRQFTILRAAVKLRRALPLRGHTEALWSRYDGTDNPAVDCGYFWIGGRYA